MKVSRGTLARTNPRTESLLKDCATAYKTGIFPSSARYRQPKKQSVTQLKVNCRPQYLSKLTSPEALAPHFKVRVAMDIDCLYAMANGGLAER